MSLLGSQRVDVNTIPMNQGRDASGVRWYCDILEGWDNTADLNVVMVNYGGGDGAIPANSFPAKEKYLTIGGACTTPTLLQTEQARSALVDALPKGEDFYVTKYEAGGPRRVRARLASAIEISNQMEEGFRWLATIVMPYPFKEDVAVIGGTAGLFAGTTILRQYDNYSAGESNFMINPSAEQNAIAGVTAIGGATVNRSTTLQDNRTACFTWTSAAANVGMSVKTDSRGSGGGWDDGGHWTGRVRVRCNIAMTVNVSFRIVYTDATFTENLLAAQAISAGTWTSFSGKVDSDPTKIVDYFEIRVTSAAATAATWYTDTFAGRPDPNINYMGALGRAESTTGWAAFFGDPNISFAVDTTHVLEGDKSIKATCTTSAATIAFGANTQQPLIVGETYTAIAWVWNDPTGGVPGINFQIPFMGGYTVPQTTTKVAGWQRLSFVFVATDTAHFPVVQAFNNPVAGQAFWVDRVSVVKGAFDLPTDIIYIDGSMPRGDWSGAAEITSSFQAGATTPTRSYSGNVRTYGTVTGGSAGVASSVTVLNAGNATAYPVFDIAGPLQAGTYEIHNDTTGDTIGFFVDISSNSHLIIDMQAHTALLDGQHVEYSMYGDWWGLPPGSNVIRLAGDAYIAGPTITVSAHSTWRN